MIFTGTCEVRACANATGALQDELSDKSTLFYDDTTTTAFQDHLGLARHPTAADAPKDKPDKAFECAANLGVADRETKTTHWARTDMQTTVNAVCMWLLS